MPAAKELVQFRQGTEWFLKRLEDFAAWQAAGHPGMPVRQCKRRRGSGTFFAAIRKRLRARSLASLLLSADPVDVLWTFHGAIQAGVAKETSPHRGAYDPHLRRLRRPWGGDWQAVELDGKPIVVLAVAGVVSGGFVFARTHERGRSRTDDSNGLAVFARRESDLPAAITVWRDLHRRFSLYNRHLVVVERNRFRVASHPSLASWSDIAPDSVLLDACSRLFRLAASPAAYHAAGVPLRGGLLVGGPPGVGKTLHVKCLIRDWLSCGPVFLISAGTATAVDLRTVYRSAAALSPALVVIEDADAVALSRDQDEDGHSASLGDLLLALDGEETAEGVYTVLTTNYPDRLDRAVVARPGRIDRIVRLGYPEPPLRLAIFEKHLTQHRLDGEVTALPAVRQLLENELGVTGDHLRALVAQAAASHVEGIGWEDAFVRAASIVKETVAVDHAAFRREMGFRDA